MFMCTYILTWKKGSANQYTTINNQQSTVHQIDHAGSTRIIVIRTRLTAFQFSYVSQHSKWARSQSHVRTLASFDSSHVLASTPSSLAIELKESQTIYFEWQIIWRNGESIDRRHSTKTPYRVKLPRRPPPESLCLLALHGECLRPCKSSRRISNRNIWWMVPPLPLLVVSLRPPRLLPVPPLVSRVARRHVTSLTRDP